MATKMGKANAKAVSVRVEYRHAARAAGQRRHDMRIGSVPAYVATERSHRNTMIIEPATPAALRTECERRRALRPHSRRMRKDASVAIAGVLTFGIEAQKILATLTPAEQDRYALTAVQAVAAAMNTTLTGLVGHRDESGVHWHFQLVAYSLDGACLSHQRPKGLYSALQNVVAKVYGRLGIERGYTKQERLNAGASTSDLIHKQVRELHDLLPAEIAAAEASLERNRRLLGETESKIKSGRGSLATLKSRAERYEKRIQKAEAVLSALPAPRTARIERVTKREKRALRPDTIATQVVEVYPVRPVLAAMKALAAKTAAAETAAAEAKIQAAEATERAETEAQQRVRLDKALLRAGAALYLAGVPRPDDQDLRQGWDEAAWYDENRESEADRRRESEAEGQYNVEMKPA